MRTDSNTMACALSAIRRARSFTLLFAGLLGALTNATAQQGEAFARLSAVTDALEQVSKEAPHPASNDELAAAIAAVDAFAPSERTDPVFVAGLLRLANAVNALDRPDVMLSWLQPLDQERLAAKDPSRQHELAVPIATALLRLGRAKEGLDRLTTALAALSQPPKADEPGAQGVRRLLALAIYVQRDYAAALTLQQQVVASARENAADVPNLVEDLRQLGRTHHRLGQRQAAYDAFEEALTLAKQKWPASHEQVLESLACLSSAAGHLGDYRAAYELLREAIAGYERTLPPTHRELLHLKQNLSQVLVQLGALAEAKRLQADVLATLEASPRRDDALYCTGLQYYARILYTEDDDDGAREAIDKVLAMLVGKVPEHDRDLGTARTLAGCLARRRLDLPEARQLLEASFAGLAQSLPLDHNFTQIACAELITTCRRQGDSARAVELAFVLLDAATASVQKAALSSRASARLVSIQNMGVQHALSLALDDLDADTRQRLVGKTLLVCQLLKGFAGHVARHANHVHDAAAGERARIATELGAPSAADSPTAVVERVRDKERLERETLRERAGTGSTTPPSTPTIEALARALPAGAAGVATVPFHRVRLDPERASGLRADDWIAGLVLLPSGDIRLVDLGSGEAMLARIDGMNASTHKQLRSMVVDPLRAAAPDATVLVLALDDCLQLVPWDALPLPSGAPVGSAVELRRVSTLLDLVAAVAPPPQGRTKMVAVGGVDYATRNGAAAPPPVAAAAPPLAMLRAGGAEFTALASSRLEVEECESSFRAAFPGSTVTLLTGNRATKTELAAALPAAAFVHFATHGFVAYDRNQEKTKIGSSGPLPDVRLALAPFSLCGLALSGANLGPDDSGRSPGLITAEELQHCDLASCQLAVLSACESALGAWSQGQGFASLHEALHIAGARYVVSTLWPVGDDGARRLMSAFYRALWLAPDQPYRALWSAKQACIAEGMTFRDWAAFQLSGI